MPQTAGERELRHRHGFRQLPVLHLRLRQARNALAQARLQLQYSSVRADRAGTLSNLQLTPGTYVPAGTPVAALVDDRIDIVADFREKSLRYVRPGDRAAVVFDARPGEVFGARVAAIDAGLRLLRPRGVMAIALYYG